MEAIFKHFEDYVAHVQRGHPQKNAHEDKQEWKVVEGIMHSKMRGFCSTMQSRIQVTDLVIMCIYFRVADESARTIVMPITVVSGHAMRDLVRIRASMIRIPRLQLPYYPTTQHVETFLSGR